MLFRSHEDESVAPDLLAKLRTTMPDVVMLHNGLVCPSLVGALAPTYAAAGKPLTIMTTACGSSAFPAGVNVRMVQMAGIDCASEASRLGLTVATFGQACDVSLKPGSKLSVGLEAHLGLEPLLVLWSGANELVRLNPTNPTYGALSATIAHNGSWFVLGREPLACEQFKTLTGQCVVPVFTWPFGQEGALRSVDLNAAAPKR